VDGREEKASTPGASAREDQRPFFAEPDF
jgi:hypothetical protein